MKPFFILLVAATFAALAVAQERSNTAPDDPYNITDVKNLIAAQQRVPLVTSGFEEKINVRMGDRAAIAILKIYTDTELSDPVNVRLYLPVIAASFLIPNLIERLDDTHPQVTLLLLKNLQEDPRDRALKAQIALLAEHIRQETQSRTP